jgi:hypothetical protein
MISARLFNLFRQVKCDPQRLKKINARLVGMVAQRKWLPVEKYIFNKAPT